ASASHTAAPTMRGGRPRTGRPRWSMSPVWRASDSPSEVARTTYRVPLRSPPGPITTISLLDPYTSAMKARSRRATWAVSTSASITMRPPMMCSPPANRSIVETSAFLQQVLVTGSLLSSSFTRAVIAMAPPFVVRVFRRAWLATEDHVPVGSSQTQGVVLSRSPHLTHGRDHELSPDALGDLPQRPLLTADHRRVGQHVVHGQI